MTMTLAKLDLLISLETNIPLLVWITVKNQYLVDKLKDYDNKLQILLSYSLFNPIKNVFVVTLI